MPKIFSHFISFNPIVNPGDKNCYFHFRMRKIIFSQVSCPRLNIYKVVVSNRRHILESVFMRWVSESWKEWF